jgi:hypothetical protein
MLVRHRPAPLKQQRTDLLADMRELLRYAVTDPTIVETQWFRRRAHRAPCQDDGTIGPGEDFIRQYRIKTKDGWSEWRRLPEDGSCRLPKEDAQVRYAVAGVTFNGW